MTDIQCLEFIEGATLSDVSETERMLNRALCGETVEGWLDRGLIAGFYKITSSRLGGRPMYRYVWHTTDQGYLHVNGSLFIGESGDSDDWLWMIGAEMIARQNKCKGIRFESQRRGHLEQALRAGFKTAGVMMEKTLDHVPA